MSVIITGMTLQEAYKIMTEPDRIGCNLIKANDKESTRYNCETETALNMARNSLKAWQEVIELIESEKSGFDKSDKVERALIYAYNTVIDIIKEYCGMEDNNDADNKV